MVELFSTSWLEKILTYWLEEEPADTAEGLVAYTEKTLDRIRAKSRKERIFLERKYAHHEAYEAMKREMLKEELRKEIVLEGAWKDKINRSIN